MIADSDRRTRHASLAAATVTTQWRYDAANRRVAEVAPDSAVDSTEYDPAGNVVTAVTRRRNPTTGTRLEIDMTYDALNRIVTRQIPAVNYQSRPTGFTISEPWTVPAFPAYTIPAETHTFTYDSVGRLLTADNADAKVKRSYYRGGLIETDSLRIQTFGRDNWETHKYGLHYRYDPEGRRTRMRVPSQLASPDTITYVYDGLGQMTTLRDIQGTAYLFGYNVLGQLTNITYPSSYQEGLRYDADGRLVGDSIWNFGASTYPRIPLAPKIRITTLAYDARNKVLRSADQVRFKDTLNSTYTGLGNLKTAHWIQNGCDGCDLPVGDRHAAAELIAQDAFANRIRMEVRDTLNGRGFTCCDTLRYQPGTGRLISSRHALYPLRTFSYDSAGNQEFSSEMDPGLPSSEQASYYAADGTLRIVDSRSAANSHAEDTQWQRYSVEDYRYDALGRRVWVRTQKRCDDYGADWKAATECRVSIVRRTIWDGDQEVVEIQMPWALQGANEGATYDTTHTPTLWENDVFTVSLAFVRTSAGSVGNKGDANPFFGRVVYAGLRGIDRPIAVTRMNYVWAMDWNNPLTTYATPQVKSPFTIVPFWNALGDAPQGVFSNGAMALCDPAASYTKCVAIAWPWDVSSTDRQRNLTRAFWQGTLLEGKRDKSGFAYHRKRYYDPRSGRFTQEDPIGLAGGLNVYGFAAGDPVNFGDPFGLKPCNEWSAIFAERVKSIKRRVRNYFRWHDLHASTAGHAEAIENDKRGLHREEEEFKNDDECKDPGDRQKIKDLVDEGWKWGNRERPDPYIPMDVWDWNRFRWSHIREWLIPALTPAATTRPSPIPGALPPPPPWVWVPIVP